MLDNVDNLVPYGPHFKEFDDSLEGLQIRMKVSNFSRDDNKTDEYVESHDNGDERVFGANAAGSLE